MFDAHDKFPAEAHVYTMLFAHLNSSLNPVLYAVSNPVYQKGYKNFIRFLFCMPVRNKQFDSKHKTNEKIEHTTRF